MRHKKYNIYNKKNIYIHICVYTYIYICNDITTYSDSSSGCTADRAGRGADAATAAATALCCSIIYINYKC